MGTPLVYVLTHRSAAWQWLREAVFRNTTALHNPDAWKRKHKSLVAVSFVLFVLTGLVQWFLKGIVPSAVFQFSMMIHDITFYFAIVVLLYHVYHEFDWWLWKKRYCSQCSFAYCADVCPTNAITSSPGGVIVRHAQRCNNCRLCMEDCQRNSYYRKSARPLQAKSEAR